MKLGVFEIFTDEDEFRYKRLRELAREAGHELVCPLLQREGEKEADWPRFWREVRELIESADTFHIRGEAILKQPEHTALLQARIHNGARAIVDVGSYDALEAFNRFLAPFDMMGSNVGVRFQDKGDAIPFKRSSHTFRDARLFAGVQELVVQGPNVIWTYGEALPVLVASEEMPVLVVELTSDYKSEFHQNLRELACVAAWHGSNGGGVLAMGGSCFTDAYRGWTGIDFPGITANETFARNVLKYLSEGTSAVTPEDRCKRIEINLADYVLELVRKSGKDWWAACVPLEIRQKCAARQEEESSRLAKEAYLDLIDLKSIMKKNWQLFEPGLRGAGLEGGKDKSLAWLDGLNELRRLVGHPLKKHVSGYEFSTEDRALLKDADELTLRLVRAMRAAPKNDTPA